MRFNFWLTGLCISLTLTACQVLPSSQVDRPLRVSNNNFASGSSLGAQLQRADSQTLRQTFLSAIDEQQAKAILWQGQTAQGSITPGRYFIANLLSDPQSMIAAPSGIDLSYDLETEQGAHVLTRNSNIRKGPSTSHAIIETLPSGTGVEGVGKTVGEDWMLISINNQIHGYVFMSLLVKAPGADSFKLAGTPVRRPYLCREFTQSLTIGRQKDRWQGLACNKGEGWKLANRGGPSLLGNSY